MKKNLKQNMLVDWSAFGRKIKSARKTAGFSNVGDFAQYLHECTNISLSERTLYKIERGEVCPTVETLIALMIVFPREEYGDILASSLINAAKDNEFAIVSLKRKSEHNSEPAQNDTEID